MIAAVLASLVMSSPHTLADLEKLAPSSTWQREKFLAPLCEDCELVVLRTKEPNRFVVRGTRAAVATVEEAVALFVPLDEKTARALVMALVKGEVITGHVPGRLAKAGFEVKPLPPPSPPRLPFNFAFFVLRGAQSQPEVVHVMLDLDEQGHVDRVERRVAFVALVPGADNSAAIEKFVAAARADERVPPPSTR